MALKKAWKAFENILPQFLTIILVIGMMLAILTPEQISSLLGKESGFTGVLIASLIGSITLVPAFVAFPLAADLLRSGARAICRSRRRLHLDYGRYRNAACRNPVLWPTCGNCAQCSRLPFLDRGGSDHGGGFMNTIDPTRPMGNPGGMPAKPAGLQGLIRKYRMFLLLLAVNLLVLLVWPDTGTKFFSLTWKNLLEMLSVLPPIFILLGLLDVWVKRETMVKYMGEGSGLVGILLAYFLGSAAAGPLYAAFPVAGVLLRKGSKLSNVFIMLGAWSTTKIPLLLFEASAMGLRFTVIRLVLDLFGIAIIAFFSVRLLTADQKKDIYIRAEAQV